MADQFVAELEDGLFDDFVAGFVGQDGLGTADQGVEFVGVFHLGGNDEDIIPSEAVGEGFGDVEDAGAEADEAQGGVFGQGFHQGEFFGVVADIDGDDAHGAGGGDVFGFFDEVAAGDDSAGMGLSEDGGEFFEGDELDGHLQGGFEFLHH